VCSDLRPESVSVRTGEAQAPTHEAIATSGGIAIFVKCDVRSASEIETLVDRAVKEYGRLDIMVNNAGIGLPDAKPVWEVEEAAWDLTQDINSKAVFLGCKYASKQMISQEPGPSGDRGWIVNLASIMGLVALAGALPYIASKHAVGGITKTVALDCAPFRVHCNAVCPGCTFRNETNISN
jgi:NAD(P)-dependent dehydrogenase (short-subunit alcohol dehydrogenase family)